MSKSSRRVFSVFLAIIMVLSMGVQAFADTPKEGRELELEDLDPSLLGIKKLGIIDEAKETLAGESHDLDDIVRVSIFLSSKSTLDAGYSAKGVGTNAAAISYRDSVKRQQADVAAAIEQRLGKALDVKWNLTLLMNVISANVRFGDIYKIKLVPGVKDVQLERLYEPQDGEASPNTANTSSFMVGASQAWSAGYTGAGSRLAIIDTGLDTSHQSFNADAFNYSIGKLSYTPDLMTSSFVSSVQSQLNGKGKYVSAKVPFAYNYVDGNTTSLDHSDGKGNHGSHVAGIAAANRYIKSGSSYVESANAVHAVGMAPDAQLVVMKVFGSGGGAYDSDYMAALEDAIVLGCDAANLSLGSAVQGFTFANSYQGVMNKLAGAENPDMLVSISAGNSYGIPQFLETDLYIDDVSMHTGGSPGTYVNSMGVASIDNTGATGAPMVFNGSQTVFYSEVSEAANASSVSSVAGSYSYVYIDSIGDTASLSAVNSAASLSGKVVIVDRGSINFSEKATNAASYSPKAIIIANNESGALGASVSGYTGKVPVGTVSLEDALLIKEGSTRKTTGSYSYYTGTVQITSTATHGQVSAREEAKVSVFSSWGVPGSLLLKPEISAPGGDIYSVNGYSTASDENVKDHTSYVSYSGTSMAAPHVTGLTGVLAEYLDRNDISVKNSALASKYSRRAIMQSLLMSTATPMKNSGQYVSLLQQGAGLVEVSRAIGAYSVVMMGENDSTLTAKTGAASDGKVKAELGDDPQRTGTYNYSFTIYNTSGSDLEFELSTDLFTQANYTEDGSVFMDQTTTGIDASVSYNWDGTVVVSGHDVDKDGDTDTDDVQAVLDYIVGNGGTDRYPGGLDLSAAEMDGKSGISSLDAYLLLNEIENASAKDGVVAAGSSRTVNVAIRLTDAQKRALEQTYTSGAYIEGFTYITCRTTDSEGRDYSHQHSIPVLGFFGSWTDPSMFDNTSFTDSLYGTEKTPYTGHSDTNYLTVRYNGTLSKFAGNPYMAESSFPADRLAVNSNSAMGSISYNLIRSAGTTGFAVSKLDEVGGNVTDVISASVTGNEVDGIWYNQSSSSWQNFGTKSYSINKSAAAFGLKEGDVFRIGFYAVPEYNAMAVNSDYSSESAGILSQAGFRNLLKANVLGRGAFIGYDFTVDNTEPVINSAVLSSNTLTVTAGDDRSLAYVAVLSLDGNTVYSKAAPAAASYSVSIDVSNAVANAKGYVAVFAADYAGNEAAKAVKVNNNTSEDPYTVSSITLVPSSLDLYKGKTSDISANVMPLTASDRSVSWTSSNTSVASVDTNGHVTAVGAGSATITATSVSNSSVKASCSVKVTSVDKDLNAIIWDEEGGVYFSTFNTGSLPAWTKNHTAAKTEELVSAFMYNTSDLYAATLDANAQESVIYTVDRSSYALTEYGTNYVLATDMAVGPSNKSYQKIVYVFGPYLLGGPLTPGDDGQGGTYCGIPQALLDCEETLDGAYLAAIACRSRSTTSSSYYVLDENGIIWQSTLSYSNRFSTLTKVMETGISTSFMYQNLYYDGTYLYWTHTDGDTAELIIINPSSKVIYRAGDFGQSVWPVGGMYVNGSVAPAAAEDELLEAEAEPEAQDAEALRPVMSRSELMSDKIMARFAAEAARSGRNRPVGGLNSISAVMKGRSHASLNGAGMTETDNGDGTVTVDVRYTETADASNGVVELSYDPEKLTFRGLGQDSASTFYALNDSEPGTVKLSYALTEAVAAGDTIFTFEFEASCSAAEITLETLEKNETLDLEGEVETIEIPESHEWSDPVWTWTGYTSAVAEFTCGRDKTHVETFNANIASVTVDPTPTTNGSVTYTATVTGPDGKTYTDTKVEVLPATGYTYKDPVYTWNKTEDGYTATALKECNEDPKQNITETVKATYSVTKPATCTEAGTGLYTAAFGNKAFEVQTLEVEIPATGHSWTFSGFEWPTDETGSIFSGQKAVFRCGGCGQIMEVAAQQSYSNYAVTVSVSAEESPDGLAHSESKRAVQLDGVSLELADKISVRYKLHVPEFADHAEIYFEADRDTSGNAYAAPWKTITLDPSDSTYYDAAKGQFVIAFPEITSREMMDHVRLVVYDKDGQPLDIYRTTKQALYAGKIDYCAADWCGDVFARYGEDASHKSVRMAMAVLNFGAEAQKYFDDYNSDKPANPKGYLADEMSALEPDPQYDLKGNVEEARKYGYRSMSLDLAESTSIRLRFEEMLDVSVDGKPAVLMPVEGRYMAVIGNLRSIDLTTMHSVSFTGTDGTERELVMCALSWCNTVFDSFGTDDNVQTVRLAKAVYLYSQAAENYFK
ncbi:MAG: S8 family serine peptidase [Firmicutes bacterium]|nr:S8 family serine peptidase [Bacillota bacterium]